jgi:MazG family protein
MVEAAFTLPMHEPLTRLLTTIERLRRECPWDQAQTPQSLCPYILEEAAELVDAIESGDTQHVLEELGDVLLQVLLQAQIYSETTEIDFMKACDRLQEKLVYRHPHVFGEVAAANAAEVIHNWEVLKAQEKAPQLLSAKLKALPRSLSSLTTAHKISRKVAKVGFDWPDLAGVLAKVHEELGELEQALAQETLARQEAELGDLLFSLVNVARWQGIDSETALRETNRRFLARFTLVEQMAENPLDQYTPTELEQLWQRAKNQLNDPSTM